MSLVRRISHPNRLTHFVNTPDGIPLADAIAAADAKLAEIKPPGLVHIDAVMAELEAKAPANPSEVQVERLYRIANELAGVGAVFGLPALGHAAYSLCELLDVLRHSGSWNAAAVGVHLDGLRLLRQEDAGLLTPAAIATVLTGLDQVVARFSLL